ncbi:MAG: UDP-N-acetylmuramoyl-L-alanyl-D-glutamate--2,6-diaminopimelate ligase [Thermoanaerobaculia bacterium]|nr:UDP-N-acetylmuramoyl-L-alanyl-D-glutamate--2,6-diaminopimelate ligase [Thermoanaerobaculia bacterium]
MKLGELLRGWEDQVVLPTADHPELHELEIRGICHDSRRAQPGDLYVAIVGERFDGRDFAREAIKQGAVAVLGPDPDRPEVQRKAQGGHVPWIVSDEPRELLGDLATRVYGSPHEDLLTVGITGTNGKTTIALLVADALGAAGRPSAVLGTLGCHFRDMTLDVGDRTTPEAPDLFRALHRIRQAGAQAMAMEISSHALDLGRLGGLKLDVAVFTNLSRDHLDHHGDMESYYRAKKRIFSRLKPGGVAVVSVVDDWGKRLVSELVEELPGDAKLVAYGLDEGDVTAASAALSLDGIQATVESPDGEIKVSSRLLGRYNLENLLATMAVCDGLDLDLEPIAAEVGQRSALPGRLEPVCAVDHQPFPAFLDYAHTPGAMEAALRSVQELTERRIILVFGCGGERDQGKRPLMGKVAGELAYVPILTSDNPRREDPMMILAAVESGVELSGNKRYELVPDRREAIRRAVEIASHDEDGVGWLVLVAGKGHETTQDLGDRVVPFSDRRELDAAIRSVLGASGVAHG